jgi:hypothetical protein
LSPGYNVDMSANICLPPKVIDKFTAALKTGKINPEKLAKMTSQERHALFTEVVGEGNAKFVNAALEEKLLLKNQQQGMLTWAKNVAGLKPEVRRDLISRVQRMQRVLDPEEAKAFLNDLAEQKLGFGVTVKEAKHIADLSQKLQQAATKQRPNGTFPSDADRMAYGYAKIDLGDFLASQKLAADKKNVKQMILQDPGETINKTAGLAKSLKASLDNSALLRQGWKALWTNPGIWLKNAKQSFVDIVRQVGERPVMREVMADIVSRPNYAKYEKMKLAVGNIEEEFPSSLPERIPGLGRLFKASETAYTAFLYRTRADIADKYLQVAERNEVNLRDREQLEKVGKLVNSLTGRGDIGRFEGKAAASLNNVFFSIKFFKSNLDTLTAHQLQKGVRASNDPAARFVRKQAAQNLLKIAAGTAAVLAIADQVLPGSVEWDSRSSDFGKIRVGNTRFDVTGGMGSIAVLASQIVSQSKKSSTSGVVKKLGGGFGEENGVDIFTGFFENKLSPLASTVRNIMKQETFSGDKPTVATEAKNLLVPIPFTTFEETKKDPNAAPSLITLIADGLGIGANTYGKSDKKFDEGGATMQAFKKAVGTEAYHKAEADYNKRYDTWLQSNRQQLMTLPTEEQQPTLSAAKQRIQKQVYKDYGFKPPKKTKSADVKQTRKTLLDAAR